MEPFSREVKDVEHNVIMYLSRIIMGSDDRLRVLTKHFLDGIKRDLLRGVNRDIILRVEGLNI